MKKLLCLSILLLSAAAARADNKPVKEPVGKLMGGRSGPITDFIEEDNAFTAVSPNGKFEVVVEKSAREARKKIHAERSKELYGGKSLGDEQKEMNARIKKNTGESNNYASVWIGITADGVLVGANRFRGPGKKDHTSNTYVLDGDGKTKKVVMSGGTRGGKPAVFVRLSEDGSTDKTWLVLTYIDTLVLKMDFEVHGSAAGGGGSDSKHIDVYDDDGNEIKRPGTEDLGGRL